MPRKWKAGWTMEHISRHLAVVLFTDIVGSVGLKNKLGTESYARLLARQRELFQEAMRVATGGTIVQHTGDGFLAEFGTSSQAVNAALAFEYLLSVEPWGNSPLLVRAGIHQGEVLVEATHDSGQEQLVGLAVDLAARVMGLAMGGQILMTRSVFDDARQYVRRHPDVGGALAKNPPIRWVAHGRYMFKGMGDGEAMEVCEVGAEGVAPLATPPDQEKARRAVAADEEETLGWRPAVGLEVPGRAGWMVERKLGEGGFGEVWLASHNRLHQQHVFKFCFDAQRLRSFKREVTLFRLLRDALGSREDFVPLYGVELENSPYYIESEFVAAGNLADWASGQGGIEAVSLRTRLALVAQTARAVAAAHSVGIIHKDIKPTNILIGRGSDGQPTARLCDFGIGVLADRTRIRQMNITEVGFTEELVGGNDSSRTGTRIYEAPEYLVGKPPTTQGDVFALGIMLYQMAIGDLNRPLAQGWERDVSDELLQEDISRCVDTDPAKRYSNAEDLARSLEQLETRREDRRQQQAAQRRAIARRRAMRLAVVASAVLALAAALCVVGYLRERDLRREAQVARNQAQAAQRVAQEQRDQTLATLNELVFNVQDKLENRVGMHALSESLLNVALKRLKDFQAGSDTADSSATRSTAMALIRLSKGFTVTGRTSQALDLLQSAKTKLVDLAAHSPQDAKAQYDLILVHDELGSVYWAMGRTKDATDCANKELTIAEQMPKGVFYSRIGMAMACGDLGGLYLKMNKPKLALDYYNRAVQTLEGPAEPDPRDALAVGHNLSKMYCEMGDVYLQLGDSTKAREYYSKDQRLTQSIAADTDDIEAKRHLAICFSRQSDLDATMGHTKDSLANQLKSQAILEPIAKGQPDDTQLQEDLAKSFGALASLYLNLGQEPAALEAYQKSLAIRKDLTAREPGNAQALANLATAYLDMGWFCSQTGHTDQVLPLCEQALAIHQTLAKADPDSPQTQRNLSTSLSDVGDANLALGHDQAAMESFEKAQKIRQSLADANPDSAQAQRDLGIGFNRLGGANLKAGNNDAALAAFTQAMKITEALAKADPDNAEAARDLAIAYFRLGRVNRQVGKPAEAKQLFVKALAVYESLAGKSEDAPSQHDLTTVCNKLGELSVEMEDLKGALEWYGKSVKVAAGAAAKFDNAASKQDLAIAYSGLGRASLLAGQNEQALANFRQALELDQAGAKAAPQDASLQHDLVCAVSNTAAAASYAGQHAVAAAYYRQAVAELDRLQQAKLLLEDQKDLAAKLKQKADDESQKAAQTQSTTAPH